MGQALGGELRGQRLVPISEIGKKPTRIEERKKQVPDDVGGVVEKTVTLPIWLDP